MNDEDWKGRPPLYCWTPRRVLDGTPGAVKTVGMGSWATCNAPLIDDVWFHDNRAVCRKHSATYLPEYDEGIRVDTTPPPLCSGVCSKYTRSKYHYHDEPDGSCDRCPCPEFVPVTCRCGRTLHGWSTGRKFCSDVCSKRERRKRRRKYITSVFENWPDLAADVFPEEAPRWLPRVCQRDGCENAVTGRKDQKWCSGSCRIAAKRERERTSPGSGTDTEPLQAIHP